MIAANALENNSMDKAIEHSTTSIQLLRDGFINQLEVPTNAWAKTKNIMKELEDVLRMIDITPEYPMAYLHSSTIYGNLGYQICAIKILQQGLDNVSLQYPQYMTCRLYCSILSRDCVYYY
ncbi:hypothetical protein BDA99DRAFT_531651 [Phascolomyces articulosus]|uniref:Uncharacterized protein n=1 Tax=Phascolomyces articulosus TaxID=60185 RepID=A0AAD5PMY3_9FUNG|nr:hypothetical protein BDA99DRAFT_531651 [Phascolomyces articulosus]